MCSDPRAWWVVLLLLVPIGAAAGEPGGHPLEFGVYAGHVDFDDEIRFQNDGVLGLAGGFGITPWLHLGLDLSRMTMRDTELERWTEATTFAIRAEVAPRAERRFSPLAFLGVSFMGFEESATTDAISEGLDLGLGARWRLSGEWNLRAILTSRMQTFRFVPVTATGEPAGRAEETGYLWSRVWRVGVTHVF